MADKIGHGIFEPLLANRAGQPLGNDGMTAPFGGDERCRHQRRQWCGVQRGGHGHQHQVVPQRPRHFEAEREAQIGRQGAFVEFVEDDGIDAGQVGAVLDHAGQNAFCHHLDPRVGRDGAVTAYPVAHGVAHRLAQGFGHPLGGGSGRQSARLQHHDAPLGKARLQQGQRHAGGLARAGRGLQHEPPLRAQGVDDLRDHRVDGQGVGHGRLIRHRPRRAKSGMDIRGHPRE